MRLLTTIPMMLLLIVSAPAAVLAASAPSPVPETAPAAEVTDDEGRKATVAPPAERRERKALEGLGRDATEEQEYGELSDAARSFDEESREFRREIQLLVEKKYQDKRQGLGASYELRITEIEVLERQERLDAIAIFERFLERYPDNPRYTPDAMFRLAELHYEKTKDDYAVEMRAYEEKLRLVEAGKLAEAPPEPRQYFQRSIDLYQRLLTRFPSYPLNDGSYYLLGFCLEKQGELDLSRDTFERLIEKYPGSRFLPEAWVRLGEYYFDASNEPDALDKAARAYTAAIGYPDHPLYDKALYKLGWTYYRMDDFGRAVDAFVQLVDFYDRQVLQEGEEGGGDLRGEAMQYMAISLADEKWGSIDRAQELFARTGPRPWEAELWRRIGDVYSDQTRWPEAIAAYRQNLVKAPLHKDAPLIQDKIVRAHEQGLRDFDRAFAERELLVQSYAPGSAWHEANKDDSEVIKAAQELSERSLYSSAVYHHQQAIQYVKTGKAEQARREFEIAARGYADYLGRFPHSKLAYELTFYLAECLYSSLQFLEAARAYEWVRDSNAGSNLQADAAYNAVLAWQKEIDAQQRATPPSLETRPALGSKDRPPDRPVQRQELPELWGRFVAAADSFVKLQPAHERAAQSAYRAAEAYYAHDDFEEARRRFAAVIEAWPDSEFARYASNLTLETFLITEDWVAVAELTNRMTSPDKDGKVAVDPGSESGRILRDFGDNAMFKQAEKLMGEQRWDEAGTLYEELVARNKSYPFADKALNNAAVCREQARRFESALKLYERIFNEYPKSELADVALFRVAVNAENSYDFDKAVDRYQLLVEKYPKSKDRAAALNNLARLLEGLQRYRDAARQFTRFAELFPADPDAPMNLYRAATIYEKMDDCPGQIRALNAFVAKFSRAAAQAERVVDAHRRIGDCQMALKNETAARQSWTRATEEYRRRGLSARDEAASSAAGYSRFMLAEHEYKRWDAIALTGRGKALERAFTSKLTQAAKLQGSYLEVYSYKSVEWVLAASYKRGFVLERFATSLVESPCPPDIKRAYGEEGCEVYRATLVDKVIGLEEKAAEAYDSTATECLKYKLVDNEWCARTRESLARLRTDYKVLKKPRIVTVDTSRYPASLVETPEGPALTRPASSGKLSEGME